MKAAISATDPFVIVDDLTLVPWGGNRSPKGKTLSTPRITVGESTGVIVGVGQSLNCDTVDATYSPTNGSKIDNFSLYDGGTYAATEPLLGCTIKDSTHVGNTMLPMADKLITAGWRQRIILVPISYSGSPIAQWAPGGNLNNRLVQICRLLASRGLSVTCFVWRQGEADKIAGTSQATYAAALAQVIATPRALGYNAPWLIGKNTYVTGSVSSGIQAAQASVINGTDIFTFGDNDSLTGTAVNRQADDIHMSYAGSLALADLDKAAIIAAVA